MYNATLAALKRLKKSSRKAPDFGRNSNLGTAPSHTYPPSPLPLTTSGFFSSAIFGLIGLLNTFFTKSIDQQTNRPTDNYK